MPSQPAIHNFRLFLIKKRTRRTLSVSGALRVFRRLGGKLKVPRKSHAKKDPAKAAKFKVKLPARLRAVAGSTPVWCSMSIAADCCG
jgi:hypothetical protein